MEMEQVNAIMYLHQRNEIWNDGTWGACTTLGTIEMHAKIKSGNLKERDSLNMQGTLEEQTGSDWVRFGLL
jgi:hypothetical protein